MDNQNFNVNEVLKRILKYFIEGAVVAFVAIVLPNRDGKSMTLLRWQEALLLAFVAAGTFAALDFFAPSIAISSRQGAGFGIGASLVGWPAPMVL
jgi:hypothetical protein